MFIYSKVIQIFVICTEKLIRSRRRRRRYSGQLEKSITKIVKAGYTSRRGQAVVVGGKAGRYKTFKLFNLYAENNDKSFLKKNQ